MENDNSCDNRKSNNRHNKRIINKITKVKKMISAIITAIIAAVVGITTAVVSATVSSSTAQQTNEANKKITEDTNKKNAQINAQNLAWQKEENEIMRQREDTAVQRRAEDLEAAGINPILAGLGGASAQPGNIISAIPAQNGSAMQNIFQGLDLSAITGMNNTISNTIAGAEAQKTTREGQKAQKEMTIEQIKTQRSQLREEIHKNRVQNETKLAEIQVIREKNLAEIEKNELGQQNEQLKLKLQEREVALKELQYDYQKFNDTTNFTEAQRTARREELKQKWDAWMKQVEANGIASRESREWSEIFLGLLNRIW